MKIKLSFENPWLVAVFTLAASTILLGGGSILSSSIAKKDGALVTVKNHTQTCTIIGAEKHKGHVKVSLRNDSQHNITAFVVALPDRSGDRFTVKEEFAYSEIDFVISPSSLYEKAIPIPSSMDNKKIISLELLAVVFDDKSSEGDSKVVREIDEERFGEKIQLLRTVALLDEMLSQQDNKISMYFHKEFKHRLELALNTPDADLMSQLRRERPRIMSGRPDELPQQIKEGLHTGQQYILGKVRDLEDLQKPQDGSIPRGEIKKLKQTCERILSRL